MKTIIMMIVSASLLLAIDTNKLYDADDKATTVIRGKIYRCVGDVLTIVSGGVAQDTVNGGPYMCTVSRHFVRKDTTPKSKVRVMSTTAYASMLKERIGDGDN